MLVYKIADLNIGINPRYEFTKKYMRDYINSDCKFPDFKITVTDEMLAFEKMQVDITENAYLEISAILRQIAVYVLNNYNGLFFHCSCFEMDGKAFVFTGPSGSGKSTHTRLWREKFKDRITIINDDKPIIRLIDGIFYIYGTPFNGKHGLSNNIKAPIQAICVLEQDNNNSIERLETIAALSELITQTVIPKNQIEMSKLLDIMEQIITKIPVYKMRCTISNEAVNLAYNAMAEIN